VEKRKGSNLADAVSDELVGKGQLRCQHQRNKKYQQESLGPLPQQRICTTYLQEESSLEGRGHNLGESNSLIR